MLVLAREVILVPVTGQQIKMRRDLALAHDVLGTHYRRCDLYLCPFVACNTCGYRVNAEEERVAEHVYPHERKQYGYVDIPSGGWQPIPGKIRQILYWRSPAQGKFQHPFDYSHKHLVPNWREVPMQAPVTLFQSTTNRAYHRLSLPANCVINPSTHVGLVIP